MKQALILALFVSSLASCAIPRADVGVSLGRLSMDGNFGVQSGPVSGTSKFSDLGIDDDQNVPGARVDLDFGMPTLAVSIASSSFDGEGTTTSTFSQSGVVIPVGTDVRTQADLDVYSSTLTFDILPSDTIELGFGVGATLVDVRGSLNQIGGPNSIDVDELLPVPLLAARLGVDLGRFELRGSVAGMDVTFDGNLVRVVDADIAARYRFLGGEERFSLAGTLGWRYARIQADYEDGDDNVRLDMTLDGPYIGLTVGF